MEKKTYVMSNSKVYALLMEQIDSVKEMKSPKEIRSELERRAVAFKPSGRGRRAIMTDYAALQAVVDESSKTLVGGKASSLASLVAYNWTKQSSDPSQAISSLRVKELVVRGKLTFPEGLEFTKRPRKVAEVS